MARFLIEVPHGAKTRECALAAKLLLNSGSHYLTNADYGCSDGVHKAWIIVEADSKEDASYIIPSLFRPQATIIRLNKFTLEQIDQILEEHRE